jgi:hypothetical protein
VKEWDTYNGTASSGGGGSVNADKIIYYIGHDKIQSESGAIGDASILTTQFKFSDLTAAGKTEQKNRGVVVMGLGATKSTLNINIRDGAHSGVSPDEPTFTIQDFPLQAWVNVTVSVYNDSIDLYINGKLVSSKYVDNLNVIFPSGAGRFVSLGNPWNTFSRTDGDQSFIDLTTGFQGHTSKFKFYNNSLTPNEAYDIYKSGPGGSSLTSMISNRGIDINFKNGKEVTSTISI